MQGLYPALSMLFPFEPENKGHGLKALKPSKVNWSKKINLTFSIGLVASSLLLVGGRLKREREDGDAVLL